MDLSILHKNKTVESALNLFLVLYAGLAKPKLPDFIKSAFENPMFKVAILSLIVYRANKNPTQSILISVAFTMTMNYLNEQKIKEQFVGPLKIKDDDTKIVKNGKIGVSILLVIVVLAIFGPIVSQMIL